VASYGGEDALPITQREFDGQWIPGHLADE
jgi:hypothetical protein